MAGIMISLSGAAQDETLNNISTSLRQYESNILNEKIYLQTDKSFYLAGEIIWFKSYTVDASEHHPLDLSKIAYVEILNSEGKPVLQGKIALQNGIGTGSFFIPLSLPSGAYKIRAYTNWMKNNGPDFFFDKDIMIVNALKKSSDSLHIKKASYDIQFFPEGGNLVDGIPSVIGFKVVDENGRGINTEGDIIDQNQKTVAHFQSQAFGMGRFNLTASASDQYRAYVKVGPNQLTVVDFPNVYRKGFTLKAESDSSTITVTVASNYEGENLPVYLLVHTRGQVKFTQMLTLVNGKASTQIKKTLLGEGISSITLFNNLKKPICERLLFRMPSSLEMTAQAELDEYQNRKKVTVNIRVNSNVTDTLKANLCISVFRVDSLQSDEAYDIRSWFYLGSDIKGNIESPEYYFTHPGEKTETALDNLMLTQGWRRFKWEDVVQNILPEFEYIPEWTGHVVNGRITDRVSGLPVENLTTYLAGPGPKSQLAGSISNKKGQILFDMSHLLGSNVLVLQTENKNDSTYRMEIANPFSEKITTHIFPVFKLSPSSRNEIQLYSVGTQVQNAYLLENLIRFKAPVFADSTSFYGEPDKKFFLDDYTRFNSMEEVVREYITGVSVHKRQGKFYFRMMDDQQKLFFDQDPLIVLDGVPIFDATEVMAIDPLRIKKIEIVNRKYFMGSLVASGIFALYSYNNDLAGVQLTNRALILEYEGLQLQREFYSPRYNTETTASKRMPDFRNVLVWDPNILVGSNHEAQVNFYTSDRKGRYMGIVEGMDPGGLTGSTHFYFDVQ
jgi:hypothetical protein